MKDVKDWTFSESSNPQSGSWIYLTQKYIAKRGWPERLSQVSDCNILYPDDVDVPDSLHSRHSWHPSAQPQWDYHLLMMKVSEQRKEAEASIVWRTLDNGARIAETAVIGEEVSIGPLSVIGPGVVLGDRVRIGELASIQRATLENDVEVGSNASIGVDAWNLVPIPEDLQESNDGPTQAKMATLGSVKISRGSTIGAGASIAAGMIGITVLEAGVHIDIGSIIHHDCQLSSGARVAAHAVLAGYCKVERDAYIGLGAHVRQRITLGSSCVVGMGSVVVKDVEPNSVVYGVPARIAE